MGGGAYNEQDSVHHGLAVTDREALVWFPSRINTSEIGPSAFPALGHWFSGCEPFWKEFNWKARNKFYSSNEDDVFLIGSARRCTY